MNVRIESVEQAEIFAGGSVLRQFDSHQIIRLKRRRNPIVRRVGNLAVITRRIDEKRQRRSEENVRRLNVRRVRLTAVTPSSTLARCTDRKDQPQNFPPDRKIASRRCSRRGDTR